MFTTKEEMKSSAAILKSLGNFYRVQIIQHLLTGEKNVSDINTVVKVSQPALSQHLAKLRKSGVLGARREARQIFYYIRSPHVIRILGSVQEAVQAA